MFTNAFLILPSTKNLGNANICNPCALGCQRGTLSESGDSAEPAAWHFVQEAAAAARDMRAIAERGVGLLG